ncbi:type II toxin-antitoxin system HicB family antitoxin [Reyranella sp.]|uniref:type II toxin-antitoxin system HicB family antitoxin n=1 Tax=Reyranella sp. TaxID=1929291 RepID=UPI003BAB9BC7
MDACYYALIDRSEDGDFSGWIPDLPGVAASGQTEGEVLRRLSGRARDCLHEMVLTGSPLPQGRALEALPQEPDTYRRLLLIMS